MARQINRDEARELLRQQFANAEEDFRSDAPIDMPKVVVANTERLFESKTQAYREALIGCVIARVLDPKIDIRLPATEYGENAFSGRSLSDNVITPFMRSKAVPVSAAPFLSAVRGGAKFQPGGQPRIQRDKLGFDALVAVVEYLRALDDKIATAYLRYLLRRFILLRETAKVPLNRIAKPNLEQLAILIDGLLSIRSGGRFPSYLATAMFQTLTECHDLGWDVGFQGINVADKFTGAVGDITVRKNGAILLGIEVTERPISIGRLTATFSEKVSPGAVTDYLFVTTARPEEDARAAARGYTAVGHEMNFVELRAWLYNNLATIGPNCRAIFQAKMIGLMDSEGTPVDLKVSWNEKMDAAIGISAD